MEFSGWDVGAVALKTVVYAATLGASGAVFFLAYSEKRLDELQQTSIRRLLSTQLIVALLATLLRIVWLTGAMTGEISRMFDREMAGMLLEAGEGISAALRVAGLALATLALTRARWLQWLALLGAALAAVSFAGVGHTRALQPHWAATTLSGLHLIGVAFWMGALVPLLIALHSAPRQAGLLAQRFGELAQVMVSLLGVAGLSLLWMVWRGHSDFWNSGYGVMLTAKLLLVAALLGAAAFNKLRLTPRLLNGENGAASSLRFSIRSEIALGLLILTVTALFTSLLGPPR